MRQVDADLRTLLHRGGGRVAFGERLIALDRLAGAAVIGATLLLAISLLSQAAGTGLLKIPSAVASNGDAPAIETPAAGSAADRLSWSNVRDLQVKLQDLGFDPGTIDGMAGNRTLAALNAYRTGQGLGVAAFVDRSTIAGLLD